VPSPAELAERFMEFSGTSTARAPLYSRLARSIAADHGLVELLTAAPEQQQITALLFAAVHHVLLEHPDAELAGHYPNLTAQPDDSDPFGAFRRFVAEHEAELRMLVATRSTQTNEVGRCAQFLLPFGMLHAERGALSMVDVGTSAGLNLLLSHYGYTYSPGGTLGAGPVHLQCDTRGGPPAPTSMPVVRAAVGLDASPIDVRRDDEVRWLEACVWPDQPDRFDRLVAAIGLARELGVDVRRGDAVADVPALVREAATHGHPVVTNSWVLNYLSLEQRTSYVAALDALGSELDLSWVIAESPAQTPGLPVVAGADEQITVITLVRWRRGERTVQRLGTTHPHGFWVHWEGAPAVSG
jgi:hypothetical protein